MDRNILSVMVPLSKIVTHTNRLLGVEKIEDYPGSHNGLQVENGGSVQRVIAAVDASLGTLQDAAAYGSGSLLVVHHGLFWSGVQQVTGVWREKLRVMFDADMAVYSVHLPLDGHDRFGNNVLLAKAVGLGGLEPFLDIGRQGEFGGTMKALVKAVAKATGRMPDACAGGRKSPRRVGVMSGGGGSMVEKASAAGVDTLITGEGPQWSWVRAEELGLNVIYAGHYATETFGVRALVEYLGGRFKLPWEFVDRAMPL